MCNSSNYLYWNTKAKRYCRMETSTPFKCFSCSTVLSSFTFTFWGECILTTTYLINHILTHIWYFPHILIYVFLVVFVMHLSLLAIGQNLIIMLVLLFFLDIHMALKVTNFMIFHSNILLFPAMSYSMKIFFLILRIFLILTHHLLIIMFSPCLYSIIFSWLSSFFFTWSSTSAHDNIFAIPSNSLHRSTRPCHKPGYLQEYHCQLAAPSLPSSSSNLLTGASSSSSIPYILSSFLSYDKLSLTHKIFSLFVSSHFEPKSFHQAIKFPQWRDAMQSEITTIEANHTLVLTDLPPNKHTIGCKWAYLLMALLSDTKLD